MYVRIRVGACKCSAVQHICEPTMLSCIFSVAPLLLIAHPSQHLIVSTIMSGVLVFSTSLCCVRVICESCCRVLVSVSFNHPYAVLGRDMLCIILVLCSVIMPVLCANNPSALSNSRKLSGLIWQTWATGIRPRHEAAQGQPDGVGNV